MQASVNNKYDYWHTDILHNYGNKLAEHMAQFYSTIGKARSELEAHGEIATAADAVAFIIEMQDIKKKVHTLFDSHLFWC